MSARRTEILCTVKSFRQRRGWSQEELAERILVRRQAVYDMESGRYLPNTAVALRLARVFGCAVEDLFVAPEPEDSRPVRIFGGAAEGDARLALGLVRGDLVGVPLAGEKAIPLRAADGLACPGGKSARVLASREELERSILIMGCDPALDILGDHIRRVLHSAKANCLFASSGRALSILAGSGAHAVATHFHNEGEGEANVAAAREKLSGMPSRILGFSFVEEGLMVAGGNPLRIRSVQDLARPGLRFFNREPGAALRRLLEARLTDAGIPVSAVPGYELQVNSHSEGAVRVACGMADSALGSRVVAEGFGIGFVPLAGTRCDLVVPLDLEDHPAVAALLDVLQSSRLKREIESLPGYDGSFTGREISRIG